MSPELLHLLFALTLASTAATSLVLGLRRPVRLLLGPATSCSMWLLVPVSSAAVLLPQAHATGATLSGLLWMAATAPTVEQVLHASVVAAGAVRSGAWLAWVMWAWIAGATVLLCCFLAGQRAFVKSLGRLSGSHRVLRTDSTAGCPAVMGLLRPKLILPADFRLRYTLVERRLILAHERAHLRRGDLAWNALATLLRCLFWFNPLAHLAAVCLRADQELACDAAVMRRHPGLRRTYAAAMLKTQLGAGSAFVCSWNSTSTLKERLRMLGRALPGPARLSLGRVCVALACLAAGYTAWAAQPPVPPTGGVPQPARNTTAEEPPPARAKSSSLELQIDGQKLHFASPGQIEVYAASMNAPGPGKDTSMQDVHLRFHVQPTPGPEDSDVSSEQILALEADSADFTELSPGNLASARFKDGCRVKLQDSSGQELWRLASAKCSLRTAAPEMPSETRQP